MLGFEPYKTSWQKKNTIYTIKTKIKFRNNPSFTLIIINYATKNLTNPILALIVILSFKVIYINKQNLI